MITIQRSDGAYLIINSAQMVWPDAKNPDNSYVRYPNGDVFKVYDLPTVTMLDETSCNFEKGWEQTHYDPNPPHGVI